MKLNEAKQMTLHQKFYNFCVKVVGGGAILELLLEGLHWQRF